MSRSKDLATVIQMLVVAIALCYLWTGIAERAVDLVACVEHAKGAREIWNCGVYVEALRISE